MENDRKKFSLVEIYKEKIVLDKESLNEIAQKNFDLYIKFLYIMVIFSFVNEISLILINIQDLKSVLPRLIYFGTFVFISVFMCVYCYLVKNCDRSKNYFYKNVPFYFTATFTFSLALYNFFIFKAYLNGLIIFEIINLIALLLYDYNPFYFFFYNTIPLYIMMPTLLREYKLSTIADIFVLTYLIIIFSFYKRILVKKNMLLANKQKHNIKIMTFGNFTIFYNQTVLKFQRKKSLELLAYLIYKKGSSVDSKELMCVLWGDRATSSVYGSSLRNLIVDIKHTMKNNNIMDFFIAEYNNFRINPSVVDCDYYNFLEGNRDGTNSFSGEFMSQYSWAEEITGYLDSIK